MCNCVPKIAKYAHFCRRKHNKRVSKFCTIFRPFCTFLRKFVHSFFISNMNRSPARFLKTIGTFWGMSVPTLKFFRIFFRGYKSQKQPVGFFLVPENACIIKLPAQQLAVPSQVSAPKSFVEYIPDWSMVIHSQCSQVGLSRRAFVENLPSNARIFVILPVYLRFWTHSECYCAVWDS